MITDNSDALYYFTFTPEFAGGIGENHGDYAIF